MNKTNSMRECANDIVENNCNVDVATNININNIVVIGTFELIAGVIAFLAILIALSDRIVKNYDEVKDHLDKLFVEAEQGYENFEPHKLVRVIEELDNLLMWYKQLNIPFIIFGVLILIIYGIWLLYNLQTYNITYTLIWFFVALSPTVGLTLVCHTQVFLARHKWMKYYSQL